MAVSEDIVPQLNADIAKTSEYLVRAFDQHTRFDYKGTSVDSLPSSTLKKFARVGITYLDRSDTLGNEREINFVIKFRPPISKKIVVPREFFIPEARRREYEQYQFLNGVPNVPEAYLIEEIVREQNQNGISFMGSRLSQLDIEKLCVLKRSIILRHVGDKTLEGEVVKNEDQKDRARAIIHSLGAILDFQKYATERANKRPDINLDKLCSERKIMRRGEDYLRASLGLNDVSEIDEELIERFAQAFTPIAKTYETQSQVLRVCHGELSLANMVLDKDMHLWLLDPKLKLRDPLYDVASALASPGANCPEEWDNVIIEFREKFLGIRTDPILPRLPLPKEQNIDELRKRLIDPQNAYGRYEVVKALKYGNVGGVINALRNYARISDLERLFRDKNERTLSERPALVDAKKDMAKSIDYTLKKLFTNPSAYEFSEKDAQDLRELHNIFVEEIMKLEPNGGSNLQGGDANMPEN
jgi:hypothetical protein